MNFNYFNALEQFEVLPLFSISNFFVFTNFIETFIFNYFFFGVIFFTAIIYLKILAKTSLQILMEKFLIFVENLVISNALLVNQKDLPFFFGLTILLVIHNLTGMIPYNFTLTSHFFVTFGLSFILFFGMNYQGIKIHKKAYLNLFLPSGIPFVLRPIIVPIEFILYFSRLLSLAIRLFANLMAGHTLLKILGTFIFQMIKFGSIFLIFDIFPVLLLIAIIIMECGIAFIQVYV